MMVFPEMLVDAAKQAGMKTPDDPDQFDANEYPHFQVFCNVQLCRPITWGEHWDNAKVVAKVPDDKIRETTLEELIAQGLHFKS
jgi:hypothetical protein